MLHAEPDECHISLQNNTMELQATQRVISRVTLLLRRDRHTSEAHELTPEDWNKGVSINLTGVFLVARHSIGAMLEQGAGSVVSCGSILGNVRQEQTAAYSAALDTPLLAEAPEELKQVLVSRHP